MVKLQVACISFFNVRSLYLCLYLRAQERTAPESQRVYTEHFDLNNFLEFESNTILTAVSGTF
jgi:hypothetical protein